MFLDTATKSLELILDAAITTNQLEYSWSWVDVDQTTQEVVGHGESDGASNSTTAVVVVAAPAAGVTRKITEGTVYNKDVVAATVTVLINNNGTRRIKCKIPLNANDTLCYEGE